MRTRAAAGQQSAWWSIPVGLGIGWLADRMVGDPQRGHPVALFGRAATALERHLYADDRAAGTAFAALAVGGPTTAMALVQRRASLHPVALTALTAVVAWAAMGGRQLGQVATRVSAHLAVEEVEAARALMPWLVGRDPASMDTDGMVRAVIESVAENTADAVVASLLWGALAGPAGITAHRAVNTLDAMVGHRNDRYARFGTAAARADDLAGLLPARLTAALTVIAAPIVGGSARAALRAWRRDGRCHPSPNAGPVEASAAGALGVTLGGPTAYGGRTEMRGPLGEGPAPALADIARVVRLTGAVSAGALVVCTLAAAVRRLAGALRPRRAGRPGG
ncbi:MAG TPA: cobalamin biosynthesis protein [Euzebya sp.]|nr:cobalamin biosynthesis protein [Euzebya sp.]